MTYFTLSRKKVNISVTLLVNTAISWVNIKVTEAYSEQCQISKMKLFPKIVTAVNYFRKMLHLRCLRLFENASG